eukprot:1945403-Amphidinium_carterae.1
MAGWSRLMNASEALVTAVLLSVYIPFIYPLHITITTLAYYKHPTPTSVVINTMAINNYYYLRHPQAQPVCNSCVQTHPPYLVYDGIYQRAKLSPIKSTPLYIVLLTTFHATTRPDLARAHMNATMRRSNACSTHQHAHLDSQSQRRQPLAQLHFYLLSNHRGADTPSYKEPVFRSLTRWRESLVL